MWRSTDATRRAWRSLSPNQRRLLSSHRNDELESEESMSRDAMSALEEAFGPRQWDVTVATLAEGEPDRDDLKTDPPNEKTLRVVGNELGYSVERTRQIEQRALRKLRNDPLIYELYFGEVRPVGQAWWMR